MKENQIESYQKMVVGLNIRITQKKDCVTIMSRTSFRVNLQSIVA